MSKSLAYRWLVGAFLALFIGLQSYSISHASEYGDASHAEDCISCEVTVLAEEQLSSEPKPVLFDLSTSDTVDTPYPDFISAPYVAPQSRAPPPRAPPFTI